MITSQTQRILPSAAAIERRMVGWLRVQMPLLTRVSMGIVYVWFGLLKFFPGLSPAEALAGRTLQALSFNAIPVSVALPLLAVWECLIGVALLSNFKPRWVGWMMIFHLLGLPPQCWTHILLRDRRMKNRVCCEKDFYPRV